MSKSNQPLYNDWYISIKNLIFGSKNSTRITTFLQIFFGPALYCNELWQVMKSKGTTMKEDDVKKEFYRSLSVDDLKEDMLNSDTETLSAFNKIIANTLCNIIMSDKFGVREEMEQECENIARAGRNKHLKKSQNANSYKNKTYVYNHYDEYKEFYIGYIAAIFETLQMVGLISDIDGIIHNVNEAIFQKKNHRLNTYSNNRFINAAYYVWNFVMLRIDSRYKTETNGLSRLRSENDENVRKDLNNYASIIEYYPVNTVERFGALKVLAAEGNLYATHELYFMYLNDTVLYDISGKMKFVLKNNVNESELLFEKLKNSNENFSSAFFRHDGHCERESFIVSLLQKYKSEYHDYDQKGIEKMMEKLFDVYYDKSIPFNIELFWFIKSLFDEYDFLRRREDFKRNIHEIQTYLSANPWISEVMNSASADSGLELHELLFALYKAKYKDRDNLIYICHMFSKGNIEFLEKYYGLADEKENEYHKLIRKADRKNINTDTLSYECTLWDTVCQILNDAINKEKEEKATKDE